MGTQIGPQTPDARFVVILVLALATVRCASRSGAFGGGAPTPWLLGAGSHETVAPSGLLAEILAFRPPPRNPPAEDIVDVAASPSLHLLRILGQHDMRHPRATKSVFSRDGHGLISIGRDGDLVSWDVVSRAAKIRVPPCGEPSGKTTAVVVSADGRFVADGNFGGWICIRSVADGAVIRSWQAYTAPIRALAATATGELISYAYRERSYDETSTGVHLAQKESGGAALRWRFDDGSTSVAEIAVGPARAVAVSGDGSRLVGLGVDAGRPH